MVTLGAASAYASPESSSSGVSPAAWSDCDIGYRIDIPASNSLKNGTLSALGCQYARGGVSQVKVKYKKTAGRTVTLRFFWELTNRDGTTVYRRYWDQGPFAQSTGQTRYYSWRYSPPGVSSPPFCLRGGLYDVNANRRYTTRVMCS